MKISDLYEKKVSNGTYAAVRLTTGTKKLVGEYIKANNIPNAVALDELHCTLLYSRKPVPDYVARGELDPTYSGTVTGVECWDNSDKTKKVLVMKLKSDDLSKRHKHLMDVHDATYDFAQYLPHVTLSYDFGSDECISIKVPNFTIEFGTEYSEELD